MSYARHQTFYLRSGWLAKALEALPCEPKLFSGDKATVRLGIGKNMVQSLRFWVRAAGLAQPVSRDKGMELTRFGEMVYENDPFFELDLTWWLIHYHIVKDEHEATSWYYLFNKFSRNEFDRITFIDAVSQYSDMAVSQSSYQKDYDCIIATYVASERVQGTPEDNTICPLTKLGLLTPMRQNVIRKSSPNTQLPLEVVFLVLSKASESLHQNISSLLEDPGNIGKIFNLSLDSIYRYLDLLEDKGWLSFSRTAGIDTISVSSPDAWDLIESNYKSIQWGDSSEA